MRYDGLAASYWSEQGQRIEQLRKKINAHARYSSMNGARSARRNRLLAKVSGPGAQVSFQREASAGSARISSSR